MAFQIEFYLHGAKIPDAGDRVDARSNDLRTIRTENSTENPVRMRQRQQGCSCVDVPYTDCFVVAGGDDPFPAGMPSPARQSLALPKWSRDGLAGHNVEDLGLSEQFNNQHALAIGAKRSFGQLAVARPHLNQLGSLFQHRSEAQAMDFLAVCRATV